MKNKKRLIILIVSAVVILGVFLRVYHFSDWLHFELDQARDAKIVVRAVEGGIGKLPLQGPRAAGSFLRLGPAFYYMEYISALIFGPTPPAIAYSVLFLSILTLPLFYFFVRRYFAIRYSIGLLTVFAVSAFMVMYSRFAWNPNPIPFFILLSLYSLLRVVNHEEKRKAIWLLISAFSLGIGTQLHFLVFLSLPAISALFLLIKRPRINWKAWVGALAIIVFLYTPVIINDVKTGGENAKEFFAAITEKSEESDHGIAEKLIRNYTEHSLGHFLVISGQEQPEIPKVETNLSITKPFDFKCDYSCRKNLPLGIMAFLFFTAGSLLLIRRNFSKISKIKKDFITLNTIWMGFIFLMLTPLAYDHAPRFYLITAPIAFVFLGLIIEAIDKKLHRRSWVVISILAICVFANLTSLQRRFEEMRSAPIVDVDIPTDRILKERARFTYGLQKQVTDYMKEFSKENGFPIYFHSESFYHRALAFTLEQQKIPQDDLKKNTIYGEGNHFLVYRTSANLDERLKDYLPSYDIAEKKEFGVITIFRLIPKLEAITSQKQELSAQEPDCDDSFSVQKRYSWNEIFKTGECYIDDEEDSSEGDM